MIGNKFARALVWLVNILFVIVIFIFSTYGILIKILTSLLVVVINDYLMGNVIKSINAELNKMKLKNFHYLSINPKLQIVIIISSLITGWIIAGILILGLDYERMNLPLFICLSVLVLVIFTDRLYGPKLSIYKGKNEVKYTLEHGDRSGTSVFGRRVGSYEDGIVLDELIIKSDDILTTQVNNEGFLIKLSENKSVMIIDKKAQAYLENSINRFR